MNRSEATSSDEETTNAPENKSLWQSMRGKAEKLSDASIATVQHAGQAAAGIVAPLVEKVGDTGEAMIVTTKVVAKKAVKTVDPAAVGGAVASMSVGEIIGGAVGGVLGSIGGPGGAVLGAELGVFAGASIGSKLGYDITHEIVHPDATCSDTKLSERAKNAAKTLVKRTGDSLGGGAGAAGGGVVGTLIAGPLGGHVGAFIGESIVGEIGEKSAVDLYATAHRKIDDARHVPATDFEPADEEKSVNAKDWLCDTALETAGETGAEAILGTVGGLVAGELGRTLGKRAGLVTARHVDWSFQSDDSGTEEPEPDD